MDETERQRREQIALRMKAGRYLAGGWGKKGATPIPTADVAQLPELLDEGISDNRLQAIEQVADNPPRRRELEAFIAALKLPADWFDGLYPSDRGTTKSVLGGLLQAVAEVAREHRLEQEATRRTQNETDHPGRAGGNGDA